MFFGPKRAVLLSAVSCNVEQFSLMSPYTGGLDFYEEVHYMDDGTPVVSQLL